MRGRLPFHLLPVYLALCAMLAGPAAAAVYVEDFNDNSMDASVWTKISHGYGPYCAEANQRLEVYIPADSHQAPTPDSFSSGYESLDRLTGDFDIQVDYRFLTWPPKNGVRVGLDLVTAEGAWLSVQRTTLGQSEPAGTYDIYMADYGAYGSSSAVATNHTLGKLRLARTGTALASYYYGTGGWNLLCSRQVPAGDMLFAVSAWSHDSAFADQDVSVAFDNFTIAQGQLAPPTPEPSGLWALAAGLAAAALKRRARR